MDSGTLDTPCHRGNTNTLCQTLSRKRARSWCFTWNNYTKKDLAQLALPNFFKSEVKKLIFQEEIGKNKTPHLQGFVQFKNPIDFHKIKEYLPECHLEKCASIRASIKYCSKEDTRLGTRYTYGISDSELAKIKIPPLSDEELLAGLREMHRKEMWTLMDENRCILCLELNPCKCPEW